MKKHNFEDGGSMQDYLEGAQAQVPDRYLDDPIEASWAQWKRGIAAGLRNSWACVVQSPSWLLTPYSLLRDQIRVCTFLHAAMDSRRIPWDVLEGSISGGHVQYPCEMVWMAKSDEDAQSAVTERTIDIMNVLSLANNEGMWEKGERALVFPMSHPDIQESMEFYADDEYSYGKEYTDFVDALRGYFTDISAAYGRPNFLIEPWTMAAAVSIFSPHPEVETNPNTEGMWSSEPALIIPMEQFMGKEPEAVADVMVAAYSAAWTQAQYHKEIYDEQFED